jgi:hypothetical protein
LVTSFWLQNTTKKAFVTNVIPFAFQYQQLFTHHHATKVVKVVTTYGKNMSIFYYHSLSEGTP